MDHFEEFCVKHHEARFTFDASMPPFPDVEHPLYTITTPRHQRRTMKPYLPDRSNRAATPSPPTEAERQADLDSFRQDWLAEINQSHGVGKESCQHKATSSGTLAEHSLPTPPNSIPELDDDSSSTNSFDRRLSFGSLYSQRNDSGFALVDSVLAGPQSSPARLNHGSQEETDGQESHLSHYALDENANHYFNNYMHLPVNDELCHYMEMDGTPRRQNFCSALDRLPGTSGVLGKRGRTSEADALDDRKQRLSKLFAPLYEWHSDANGSPSKRVKLEEMRQDGIVWGNCAPVEYKY